MSTVSSSTIQASPIGLSPEQTNLGKGVLARGKQSLISKLTPIQERLAALGPQKTALVAERDKWQHRFEQYQVQYSEFESRKAREEADLKKHDATLTGMKELTDAEQYLLTYLAKNDPLATDENNFFNIGHIQKIHDICGFILKHQPPLQTAHAARDAILRSRTHSPTISSESAKLKAQVEKGLADAQAELAAVEREIAVKSKVADDLQAKVAESDNAIRLFEGLPSPMLEDTKTFTLNWLQVAVKEKNSELQSLSAQGTDLQANYNKAANYQRYANLEIQSQKEAAELESAIRTLQNTKAELEAKIKKQEEKLQTMEKSNGQWEALRMSFGFSTEELLQNNLYKTAQASLLQARQALENFSKELTAAQEGIDKNQGALKIKRQVNATAKKSKADLNISVQWVDTILSQVKQLHDKQEAAKNELKSLNSCIESIKLFKLLPPSPQKPSIPPASPSSSSAPAASRISPPPSALRTNAPDFSLDSARLISVEPPQPANSPKTANSTGNGHGSPKANGTANGHTPPKVVTSNRTYIDPTIKAADSSAKGTAAAVNDAASGSLYHIKKSSRRRKTTQFIPFTSATAPASSSSTSVLTTAATTQQTRNKIGRPLLPRDEEGNIIREADRAAKRIKTSGDAEAKIKTSASSSSTTLSTAAVAVRDIDAMIGSPAAMPDKAVFAKNPLLSLLTAHNLKWPTVQNLIESQSDKKAFINAAVNGWTPLLLLCAKGKSDLLLPFLEQYQDLIDFTAAITGWNALQLFVYQPNLKDVKKSELNAIIDILCEKMNVNATNLPPLVIACMKVNEEQVDGLVRIESIDLNVRWNGWTPLLLAAKNNNSSIFNALLDAVREWDDEERTPVNQGVTVQAEGPCKGMTVRQVAEHFHSDKILHRLTELEKRNRNNTWNFANVSGKRAAATAATAALKK